MQNANTGGSQTQLLSSATEINKSTQIVLTNQSNFESKISLYNIDKFYRDVILKSSSYIQLSRKNSNSAFRYPYKNGIIEGFNLVIYLRNSDNSPIGYTEFNRLQGTSRNLNIYVNITTNVDSDCKVLFEKNNLSQLKNGNLNLFLLGDNPEDYTSAEKVLLNLPEPNPSYTIHLEDLDNNKSIFTSTVGLFRDSAYKMKILNNRDFDPHKVGFTDYSFSKNKSDIIVLEWVDNKYSIYSTTLSNNFGNPRLYTRDNLDFRKNTDHSLGYDTVPLINGANSQKIISCAGRYILVDIDGNSFIYDVIEDSFVSSSTGIVLDERAYKTGLIHLENGYENHVLGCPDMLNLLLDVEPLFSKGITIYRKIGSVYIFKYSSQNLYILASPTLTIYMTSYDLGKMVIINESTVLFKESGYYVIYSGYLNTYYTERSRNLVEGGYIEWTEIGGKQIIFNQNGKLDQEYKDLYCSGKISIVLLTEELKDTVLNKYRRNYYPVDIKGMPDIVGACDGILFYKNQNTINYL